ncbi:MAG TPA: hypothetical protein VNV87_07170 [Acidimicrobiales bacterium]|jgi:hypothetical protein|nr:hypothetical protein [Acidimicrobiales bacterium]
MTPLKRDIDAFDPRVVSVEVTPAGRELLHGYRLARVDAVCNLIETLPPGEAITCRHASESPYSERLACFMTEVERDHFDKMN